MIGPLLLLSPGLTDTPSTHQGARLAANATPPLTTAPTHAHRLRSPAAAGQDAAPAAALSSECRLHLLLLHHLGYREVFGLAGEEGTAGRGWLSTTPLAAAHSSSAAVVEVAAAETAAAAVSEVAVAAAAEAAVVPEVYCQRGAV